MKTPIASPPASLLQRAAHGLRNLLPWERTPLTSPAGSRASLPRAPRKFGWARDIIPGATAPLEAQVRALLADPEIQAMMRATPQAGREFRPVCNMLGIEPELILWPPGMEPKPRGRRAPAPATLEPAHPSPGIPTPPPMLQDNARSSTGKPKKHRGKPGRH